MFFSFISFIESINVGLITKELTESGSLNGILRNLQAKHGNLVSNGILSVSASSVYGTGWEPNNILYDDDHHYLSLDYPKQNLTIDFLDNLIQVNNYTIKSIYHPYSSKGWKLMGSMDCYQWTTISEVVDDTQLCPGSVSKSYSCGVNNLFRFIRIMNTEFRCFHNNNYFSFTAIEFFGTMNSNQSYDMFYCSNIHLCTYLSLAHVILSFIGFAISIS